MGLDLSVGMNVNTGLSESIIQLKPELGVWCTNRLDFQRDSELFDKIMLELEWKKPTFPIRWYNDYGIEIITKDECGSDITYVLAKEFKKIEISPTYSDWNINVLCFLQNIREDTVVVLYWN